MSNNTGELEECLSEEVGRMGEGFVDLTIMCLIITPILITSGGMLWFRNRKNAYLSRRNPTLVAFSVIPLLANMFASHFYRISLNSNFYFASCGFSNFWFIFMGLSLFTPNTCRIICFHYPVKYHQTLGKLNNGWERKKSHVTASSIVSTKTLANAAYKANANYTIRMAEVMFLVAACCAFCYIFLTCPVPLFGLENCEFGFTNGPIMALIAVPFLPQVALNIYFGRMVKLAPDPFGIKREIDIFNILFLFGIGIIFVDGMDPGNLAKRDSDEEIKFKLVALNDFVQYAMFLHAVHFQIYKAIKLKGTIALSAPLSFDKVLSNDAARDLFRLFLQSEFSGENLVAYGLMLSWKTRFNKSNNEIRVNEAKNIFRVWIDPTSDSAIGLNLGYEMTHQLAQDLENLVHYPETLFVDVIDELYDLMARDAFIRFAQSEDYKTFVGLSDPASAVEDEI